MDSDDDVCVGDSEMPLAHSQYSTPSTPRSVVGTGTGECVYRPKIMSWQAVRKFIMLAAQSAEASFYDDLEGGTFGTLKKGIRRPLSNFNFLFKCKIIATSSSTGFLVTIIPEENAHLEEHTQ